MKASKRPEKVIKYGLTASQMGGNPEPLQTLHFQIAQEKLARERARMAVDLFILAMLREQGGD